MSRPVVVTGYISVSGQSVPEYVCMYVSVHECELHEQEETPSGVLQEYIPPLMHLIVI